MKAIATTPVTELNLILVRAGATQLDAQGRITGALDSPLCEAAEALVEETASQLSFVDATAIYAAACESAQQTAQMLANDRSLKVKVIPDLTNLDCGLWHGKKIDELKSTQPRLFRTWTESPESVCPPEGETIAEASTRVERVVARLRKRHRQGNVIIVAPAPLFTVLRRQLDEGSAESDEPATWSTLWPSVTSSGEWETMPVQPVGA